VQAYDFCDRLRVSDHRAVSMTIRLEVNTAVNFQNHTPIATPDSMPEVSASSGTPFCVGLSYKFSFSNFLL